MDELVANVDGLVDAAPHLYASWSNENLYAGQDERHIAIWPEAEPEVRAGLVAATKPVDEVAQSYVIAVWEDASAESARSFDDDQANIDFLDLAEDIIARLYVMANDDLGLAGSDVHYQGVQFGPRGPVRAMALRFTKRLYRAFT
jgi:hypothetical protein